MITTIKDLQGMSDEQARAAVADVRHPQLDEFIARLPRTRFSDLILFLISPEEVGSLVNPEDDIPMRDMEIYIAKAMMEIYEEINRRVPLAGGASK